MTTRTHTGTKQARTMHEAQPKMQQRSYEIQPFGQQYSVPIGLPEDAIKKSVELLNRVLADSIALYLLYKKHHWQVAGPTFYQLHLLLDEHAEQVLLTVDLIAERIQALGGVSVAMPQDVSEMTQIERPPRGRENVPSMLARTVNAHTAIIKLLREAIEVTEQNKDMGTNDLLVSDVLRLHEKQVWFISEHLVDTPFIESDNKSNGA